MLVSRGNCSLRLRQLISKDFLRARPAKVQKYLKFIAMYPPDSFVDYNTNSMLGNIENTSSSTVVILMWHTLLDGSISLQYTYTSDAVFSMQVFSSSINDSMTLQPTFKWCKMAQCIIILYHAEDLHSIQDQYN